MSWKKMWVFGRFIESKGLGPHVADSSAWAQCLDGLHWAEGMLTFVGENLSTQDTVGEDSPYATLWLGSGNGYICSYDKRRWFCLGCSACPRQLQMEQDWGRAHPPIPGISEALVSLAMKESMLSPQMTKSNWVNLKNVQASILSHLAAPSAHILLSASCRHTGIKREK